MLKSKNVRRTIALMLCLIMMMSVASFAVGEVSNELLPLSVVQFFAEQGYDISRTARMELVQNNSRTSAYGLNLNPLNSEPECTLRITEQNENRVTVYNTILLSKSEAGVYERDNAIMEYIVTRGEGTPVNGGTEIVGNKIALTASTSYTTYTKQGLGTLYRPMSVSFSYSTYQECLVGYITVSYTTGGNAYSIPELNHIVDEYGHTITKNVSVPTAGILYSQSNPCPYALFIATGGSFNSGGMAIGYELRIDGNYYYGEID